MSVATSPSPFHLRAKRQLDEELGGDLAEGSLRQLHHVHHHAKRIRHLLASPSAGRCVPLAEAPAYAISASSLTALLALFPDMDEKVRAARRPGAGERRPQWGGLADPRWKVALACGRLWQDRT